MSAPAEILRLLERFAQQRESYQAAPYKELPIRVEFIDPFFKALGWDVHNEQGYAEAYKDVIHEDALKIGEATEAPDSCFRIGGVRKFFVECKKPSVNIKDAPHPAFQLRRYAWSAKLPLSILTDFEEFAVYDGRIPPRKTDAASVGRVLYLTCDDYAVRWDEIAAIFSREAVLKGSFDKFAEGSKSKRGTASVDDAFLVEIERWRDLLARNIAVRNPDLSQRDLNFAVQRTIDRIIFLRICEDRGIEPYGRLMTLRNGVRVYPRLCEFFQRADERYNSGLFHFQREKDRTEAPDELSLSLKVDDKVLKDIVANLYYPDSPYEFSVLSADILGQVYERFLGNVIRLTAGHQAKVEKKPEVRNTNGVFYTPDFITKAIVHQTIGAQLEGRTPRQVAKLRFCDMACGSGSFLIAAFQHLLDWHLDYYTQHDPETWLKGRTTCIYQVSSSPLTPETRHPQPVFRLTTDERKRILLNNIFGVDIDAQAVEVTKLSLLLKVLEGESQESISKQLELFHQRALPDLGSNIKCGNSLIRTEANPHQQLSLLPEEDRHRINAFDWAHGFPEVMQAGGFDAIIGNPPYIRIQVMKQWAPVEVELYKELFRSAAAGNYDLYVVFVEKALALLNKTGRMGFILPHKFFNAQYGAALRGLLAAGRHLSRVVHFGDQQIFAGATTYTCLLFLDKAGAAECHVEKVTDLTSWRLAGGTESVAVRAGDADGMSRSGPVPSLPVMSEKGAIPASAITASEWNFTVGAGAGLVNRLREAYPPLGEVADIFVGLQTSADDVFIMDFISETARTLTLRSEVLQQDCVFEKSLLHPVVSGQDVSAFATLPKRQYILFPYSVANEKAALIPLPEIERLFPKTAAYLMANKERLSERERGKFKGSAWYRFGRSQNLGIQSRGKICVPRLVDELCAAYDGDGSHFLDNVDVGGVTFKPAFARHDLRYLVALLNSRLLRWFFPHVSAPFRGGWFSANRQFLSQVPFRLLDLAKPDDKTDHDLLVQMVDQVILLHQQRTAAKSPREKESLARQIHSATRELDAIVYRLYGLTEADVRVVEGG